MRKKKAQRKRKPRKVTSGDEVVDWVFERVCDILDREDIRVVIQRHVGHGFVGRMYKPYECRHKYDGYCIHLVSKSSQRGKWRIFFHELLHILFEHAREEAILEGEYLFWERMSEEQKQIIAWYLDRRKRKK